MSMKEIQKDIINNEKKYKNEILNPLKKIIDNENKQKKILENAMKIAKKDGMDILEIDLENILHEFWMFFEEDNEYIPGYIEEYTDKIKKTFYSTKGVSISKISQYILNKYLGN